jgi:hypothetical protein
MEVQLWQVAECQVRSFIIHSGFINGTLVDGVLLAFRHWSLKHRRRNVQEYEER